MLNKIILAATLAIGVSGVALAQNNEGSQTPSPSDKAGQIGEPMGMPQGWTGTIGDAFFSDANMTMRSQDEITTNWGNLSAEQQAQVRLDCDNMKTAMNDTGAASTGMSTSSTTATGSSAGGGTAGVADSASNTTMNQVCDWVATQ